MFKNKLPRSFRWGSGLIKNSNGNDDDGNNLQDRISDSTPIEILEKYGLKPLSELERENFAKLYLQSFSIPVTKLPM